MLTEIGKLFHPLYHALAYLLVFWYGLVPNYAVAISLFTVTVMVVLAPLTVKSTRSMLAMQRLQPEVNKLKEKYKNDKMAMQTEMSQLFKANGINPAGGCLPMLIQLPVFIVLYKMIEGLTKVLHGKVDPQYISHTSLLYKHLIAAHGAMTSFGMNLAKAATSSHGSFLAALPFYGLLVVCIGLQFVQMRQLSSRAPKQTGAAAQTQAVMKFMPLIFGFIYLAIPAGVNVYFFVSSLFRIGQQELMYRFDPQVRGHAEAMAATPAQGVVVRAATNLRSDEAAPAAPVGFLASLRAARADMTSGAGGAGASRTGAAVSGTARSGTARSGTARSSPGTRPNTRPARPGTATSQSVRRPAGAKGAPSGANGAMKAGQRPPPRKPGASTSPQAGTGGNGIAHKAKGPKPAASKAARDVGAPEGTKPNGTKPNGTKPTGSKPNGTRQETSTAASEPLPVSEPRARPNGTAPKVAGPSPRDAKTSASADAGNSRTSTDPQSQSWARPPREGARAPTGGGRSPARTTTQTVDGPVKPKADSPPNRSRAKRARRSR